MGGQGGIDASSESSSNSEVVLLKKRRQNHDEFKAFSETSESERGEQESYKLQKKLFFQIVLVFLTEHL